MCPWTCCSIRAQVTFCVIYTNIPHHNVYTPGSPRLSPNINSPPVTRTSLFLHRIPICLLLYNAILFLCMSISTQDCDCYVLYILSVFAERMARSINEWIKAITTYEYLRSCKFIKFARIFNKTLKEWTQDRKDMIGRGENQATQW